MLLGGGVVGEVGAGMVGLGVGDVGTGVDCKSDIFARFGGLV